MGRRLSEAHPKVNPQDMLCPSKPERDMKSPSTLVTAAQIEQVLEVTDSFHLDRDSIVIPLKTDEPSGKVIVLPDGKVLLHPAPGGAFQAWFELLPGVLASLDLRKTRRAWSA